MPARHKFSAGASRTPLERADGRRTLGRMRLRVLLAALLCAVAVAAGSAARPVAADSPITVQLGVGTDSITMTPFYLAEKMGYFKAEGLNVQFVPLPSAALMIAPLGAGQLDVGGGAITAGLYNAVGRGIDLKIVADLGSDPPGYGFQTLVVRNSLLASGGYKSVKDLRGKRIAITARGISTSALVAALLKTGGLTMNDVTMMYMPVADQIAAMRNGSLDASLMPEPGPSLAEKEKVGTKMLRDDAYYPNQQIVAMLYGSNFLKKNRVAGLRFMRAYLRGVRLYNDNLKNGKLSGKQSDIVMSIFAEATHQDRSVLNRVTPSGDNPNGRLNVLTMRSDLDFFKAQGLIDTPTITAEDAIDATFAADAVKQLGPYRSRP
jgi:NitT/TauT family transport system substrate-binding protein